MWTFRPENPGLWRALPEDEDDDDNARVIITTLIGFLLHARHCSKKSP